MITSIQNLAAKASAARAPYLHQALSSWEFVPVFICQRPPREGAAGRQPWEFVPVFVCPRLQPGGSRAISLQARFSAASRPALACFFAPLIPSKANREAALKRAKNLHNTQPPRLKPRANKNYLILCDMWHHWKP